MNDLGMDHYDMHIHYSIKVIQNVNIINDYMDKVVETNEFAVDST